jgi:hypothetical protein
MKLLEWGPLDLSPDSPGHRIILDSAFTWLASLPEDRRGTCALRTTGFTLLYRAQRWHEAARALDDLTAADCLESPAFAMYRAPLAVHLGDIDRARAIADTFPWVDHHLRSVPLGDQNFWKARVEAIAGEPAKAVAFLRAANRKGIPFDALHYGTARMDFDAIWDYAPLQQLLDERDCVNDEFTGQTMAGLRRRSAK